MGRKKIDVVIGARYGRLQILAEAPAIGRYRKVVCRCDCGELTITRISSLHARNTVSCGCMRGSHGHRRRGNSSSTYTSWKKMRSRCYNPRHDRYQHYGGRGIRVCDRWTHFENFLQDMKEAPPGMQIDRIDNDGDYSPENCRWATRKEQANNKSNNVWLEFDTKRMTIAQWAEHLGVSWKLLYDRNRLGWSTERILTTPSRRKK